MGASRSGLRGGRARPGSSGLRVQTRRRYGLLGLVAKEPATWVLAARDLLMACLRRDAFLSKDRRWPARMRDARSRGVVCWGREIPARSPDDRQAGFCFPVFFKQRIPQNRNSCYKLSYDCFDLKSASTGSARAAGSAGRLIHMITMTLFRRGRPRKKKWPRGVGVTHWKRSIRRRKFKDFL
jgi:hypothetical protein